MEDVKKAYGLSGEVEVMFERRMRYKSLFEKDFFFPHNMLSSHLNGMSPNT